MKCSECRQIPGTAETCSNRSAIIFYRNRLTPRPHPLPPLSPTPVKTISSTAEIYTARECGASQRGNYFCGESNGGIISAGNQIMCITAMTCCRDCVIAPHQPLRRMVHTLKEMLSQLIDVLCSMWMNMYVRINGCACDLLQYCT